MRLIKELMRWDSCGMSSAEVYISNKVPTGEFKQFSPYEINQLFKIKDIPFAATKNANYMVYYNYHSSSGHRTDIFIDNENKINIKVNEPEGGVLCAFWSEVIIFITEEMR